MAGGKGDLQNGAGAPRNRGRFKQRQDLHPIKFDDMEDAAVSRGMPKPGSDVERPSLHALNKVAKALVGPSATYEYLPWETFINLEEEMVLSRAGKLPKVNKELVMTSCTSQQ